MSSNNHTNGTSPSMKNTSTGAELVLDHSTVLADKKFHEKVDFYLHRPIVEYLVIFLIIVDALLVTASLMLEIKIIEAEAGSSHDSSVTMNSDPTVTTGAHTVKYKTEKLEHAAEALHYSSLAILTLFLIEVFLKLYGQREKFFHRKVQVVDAFVVGISFALDVAIVIIQIDSTIMQGLALIIILRLWRLVRIVNGAVVATKEQLTEHIHAANREANEAKEHVLTLQMQIEDKEKEIEFLKSRLRKYEPIDLVPTGSTRLPAYLPETKEFPKQVLGDVTDDEDYRMSVFSDINSQMGTRNRPRPVLNHGGAFQAYQPGTTYQPTSQFPADQMKSHSVNARSANYIPNDNYHGNLDIHGGLDNDMIDTADESDVVSIKPPKSRSGNTFTVKKDGVPMTSL